MEEKKKNLFKNKRPKRRTSKLKSGTKEREDFSLEGENKKEKKENKYLTSPPKGSENFNFLINRLNTKPVRPKDYKPVRENKKVKNYINFSGW